MQWSKIVSLLTDSKPPHIVGAYVQLALSVLAYLEKDLYAARLGTILEGAAITRVGGGGTFVPHAVAATKDGACLVGVEGTRNWQQWALYATDAQWTAWPTGRGTVYGAFLTVFLGARTALLAAVAGVPKVFLAGHSLGAAVATFFARQLGDIGAPPVNVYTYGAPQCVDTDWLRAFTVLQWSLDHPLDPVPRAPTNVLAALGTPSLSLPYSRGFVPTGVPWCLPQWAGIAGSSPNVDALQAFAASFAAPSLSLHQTFQYLGAMTLAMSPAERSYVEDLETLLRDLGLYAPWP